jgi:hypothetical protein
VGIARITDSTRFVCPFCANRPLRCACDDPWKYDEPIIQCTRCQFWVHKSCAGFTFGPNPHNFSCWQCEPVVYHIPPFFFREDSLCRDEICRPAVDRLAILAKLPEGELRDKLSEDLDHKEFDFRKTMRSYLDIFAPCLFDYTREFWRTFVSSLSVLLEADKSDILAAIDELIINLWYLPPCGADEEPIPGLVVSDAITSNIEAEPFTLFDVVPMDVPLFLTQERRVLIQKAVEPGAFICEMPGLLCHEDEVDATQGIPRSCINIPVTQIVIDVSRSTNPILKHIRRSFHYNCLAKIIRVGGDVHVGLYATKLRGPMLEDKSLHGIPENGELFLSLDADLPYPVDRPFWKAKKEKCAPKSRTRPRAARVSSGDEPKPKPSRKEVRVEPKTMKTRAKAEFPFALTLLSLFCDDACPPMLVVLRDTAEAKQETGIRSRLRRVRQGSD